MYVDHGPQLLLRRRQCLAEGGCDRVVRTGVCWRHLFTSRAADPLTVDPEDLTLSAGAFDAWWPIARARAMHLSESMLRRRAEFLWSDFALSDEVEVITRLARDPLVDRMLLAWQRETGAPAWRLPPDGWVLAAMRSAYPYLVVPDYESRGDRRGYDAVARQALDRRMPVTAPFQPVAVHRLEDPDLLRALQVQELTNLDVFNRHPNAVAGVKSDGCQNSAAELFADPDVDTRLPSDTVVYHQMNLRFETDFLFDRNRVTNTSVRRHLQLVEGDLVRYEHSFSATPRAYWFGSVNPRPAWLNDNNNDQRESGLRLELNSRAGLYLGAQAGAIAGSHLGTEREVLIPAGTTWRVVGVRDVIQGDHCPPNRETFERLRAVQMIEIDPADVGDVPVQHMTFAFPRPSDGLGTLG